MVGKSLCRYCEKTFGDAGARPALIKVSVKRSKQLFLYELSSVCTERKEP